MKKGMSKLPDPPRIRGQVVARLSVVVSHTCLSPDVEGHSYRNERSKNLLTDSEADFRDQDPEEFILGRLLSEVLVSKAPYNHISCLMVLAQAVRDTVSTMPPTPAEELSELDRAITDFKKAAEAMLRSGYEDTEP